MAKLTFTLTEIFEIAKKNNILPKQIESIYFENDNIKLAIKPATLIPSLTINIRFDNYNNGIVHLELASRFIAKQIKKYFKQLDKFNWIEIHNTQILLFPNRIIQEYIIGIKIKDINLNNDLISIETENI